MKYKPFIYSALILLIFVGLVFYNYLQAQKAIRETHPSPLSLNLVSFPESVQVGQPATFAWHIDASPDLVTNSTTIYWDYEGTPSALTKSDSPDAVHYANFQSDYFTGNFKLPDNFDLHITFNRPGRVWFRAYAQVRNDHLWSDEKYVDVVK